MKILFLCHSEADFGETFLWNGLRGVLSEEAVVDFPPKLSYRGEMDSRPMNETRENGSPDEMGFTTPYLFIKATTQDRYTLERVLDEYSTFDFITFTPRKMAVDALSVIQSRVEQNIPCFLTDHEDSDTVRDDLGVRFGVKAYFKRELVPGMRSEFPLHPLPFSSYLDEETIKWYASSTESLKKTGDVFGMFGLTYQRREDAVQLARTSGRTFLGGTDQRLDHVQYLESIASHRIGLSIRGWGLDTVRFWEVPSFPTVLLADTLPLIIPNPFIDGVNAVFVREDLSDLVEKIHSTLDGDWEAIARRGMEHLREYHTNAARATYFLKEIEQYL